MITTLKRSRLLAWLLVLALAAPGMTAAQQAGSATPPTGSAAAQSAGTGAAFTPEQLEQVAGAGRALS